METRIAIGTILIDRRTLLPHSLWSQSDWISEGWILIRNLDRYKLGRKASEAGWQLSSLAEEINVSRAGIFRMDATIHRALRQLLAGIESESFNCLEITDIESVRYFGIHFARVSGRPRSIREQQLPQTVHTLPGIVEWGANVSKEW